MSPESSGVFAFWGLALLSIAGTLVAAFFGLGAAAAGSLNAGDLAPEHPAGKSARIAVASLDVLLALGSIALVLFWSVIALIGMLVGTVRSPVLIWFPLLGSALSGGALISAAIAQFMRKRHRWAVQLAAIAVPALTALANLFLDHVMP